MTAKSKNIILGIIIAGAIVIADQLIKNIIVKNLAVNQTITVIPDFFAISYRQNPGIAFSMFENMPSYIFAALTVIVIIAMFIFIRPYFKYRPAAIFSGFIIGGAFGNLIDRLSRFELAIKKHIVVDYLEFSFFPTFNLADTFICIGVFLLIIYIVIIEKNNKD